MYNMSTNKENRTEVLELNKIIKELNISLKFLKTEL